MVDRELRLEILSAFFGVDIQQGTPGQSLTVQGFHLATILGRNSIYGTSTIGNFSINKDFLDPSFDFDFTQVSESDPCERGNEAYNRPLGWYRMALKVKDKYSDGNAWLGPNGLRSYSVSGEWPVSYHGTSQDCAKGIITSHYKAGEGAAHGRGIYSTPNLREAEKRYAKTFTSKITGKVYKVILQNRINPDERKKCRRDDYWLIPVPKGTSEQAEKEIVERSIRPYGILFKEVGSSQTLVSAAPSTLTQTVPPPPSPPTQTVPPPNNAAPNAPPVVQAFAILFGLLCVALAGVSLAKVLYFIVYILFSIICYSLSLFIWVFMSSLKLIMTVLVIFVIIQVLYIKVME